jgi:hypothetical protein
MKKINYFTKVKIFFSYRKSLNKIRTELESSFNARIDNASRIYTVINIPPSLIEEPYNLRKEDIDNLAKTYMSDYTKKISNYLNSKNLMELYDLYEIKKVDKYSYLIILGFSLFDSSQFLLRYYTFLIISSIISIITILLIFI